MVYNHFVVVTIETRPMTFSQGNYIAYNFENVNHTRPIATAKLVIGFKTAQLDVGLAQITGILVLKNIVLSFFNTL